jgi:GNAT superfamily N-acetyltransferase
MAEAVLYRTGGAEDLASARAFVERVVAREYDPLLADAVRHDSDAAAASFDAERDLLLTAERAGQFAGTLLVTRDAGASDSARFNWLVVDGSVRNDGIGRELMFRGIEACRERRLRVLRGRSFAASAAGPHLYWLFGFRVVELLPLGVASGTRETILFEKRLSPPAGGTGDDVDSKGAP